MTEETYQISIERIKHLTLHYSKLKESELQELRNLDRACEEYESWKLRNN